MNDILRKASSSLVLLAILLTNTPGLALASRVGVALSPTETEVWVGNKIHVVASFSNDENSNSASDLVLSDGGAGGVFYGASGSVCDDSEISGSVTINSDWNNKNFCYANNVSGTYTITATLTERVEGAVPLVGTTNLTFIGQTIVLNPVPETMTEDDLLLFDGTVNTDEGGSKYVLTEVYNGFGCDAGIYIDSELGMVEEGEFDFTYGGEFGSFSAGDYSIKSILLTTEVGTTWAESECHDFSVTSSEVMTEGYLTIEKRVEYYEGDWSFDFTGDVGDFTLTNNGGEEYGSILSRDFTVEAGLVSITEESSQNWELGSVVCEYEVLEYAPTLMGIFDPELPVIETTGPLVSLDEAAGTFVVDVPEDQSVRCVVTNVYVPPAMGYLTIEKAVSNFEGDWSFDFTGDIGDFTLTNTAVFDERKSGEVAYFEVPSGMVNIQELDIKDWDMSAVVCEYENIFAKIVLDEETSDEKVVMSPLVSFNEKTQGFVVDVPEDQSVRCVVTNTYNEERKGGSSSTKVKDRNRLPTAPVAPTVGLTTATSCSPLLTQYLRQGWDNDVTEVTKLQNFLNQYGFPVPVSGFFGPLTHAAVSLFQEKYLSDVLTPWGISYSTGFVYKTTKHKINNLVCPGSESMPELD